MNYLDIIKPTYTTATKKPANELINEWFAINKQLDEIPTQYLLDSLKKSEADDVISFAIGKDALNYLDEMITNDKRNR